MLCLHNAVNLILKSTIAGGWYIVQANWTNRHKSHQLKSIVKNQHVQFDRHYSYHHQVWTCQEPGIFRTDNLNFTIRSKGNWLLTSKDTCRKDTTLNYWISPSEKILAENTCRKFRYNSIQIDSNSNSNTTPFLTIDIWQKWKTGNRASYCFSLVAYGTSTCTLTQALVASPTLALAALANWALGHQVSFLMLVHVSHVTELETPWCADGIESWCQSEHSIHWLGTATPTSGYPCDRFAIFLE